MPKKYNPEELTPLQNQALCLLAAGYSNDEVITQTGISKTTIMRWKKHPKFQSQLRESVAATYDAAIAELVSNSRDAARELKRIIDDPDVPSRTKVSAISVLLSNAAKAKESILEERLERMENTLNGFDTEQDSET